MQFRFSFSNTKYFLPVLLCTAMACERTAPSNTEAGDQTENKAEQELAEFREWVSTQAEKGDSIGKEKGPKVREEFEQRSARLDSGMENLSEKSKAEYKELRRKYSNWQARGSQRSETALAQETLDRFELELLGSATALDLGWSATDVQPVYARFVQNVRAKRQNWTASDWDYVDELYSQLNKKKDPFEDQLSGGDKIKIKALQTEYLSMETASDAKGLYQEIKKD